MKILINKLPYFILRKKMFLMTYKPYDFETKISQAKFHLVDWMMRFKCIVSLVFFVYWPKVLIINVNSRSHAHNFKWFKQQ